MLTEFEKKSLKQVISKFRPGIEKSCVPSYELPIQAPYLVVTTDELNLIFEVWAMGTHKMHDFETEVKITSRLCLLL